MKTFTRIPWIYWADRIFITVILIGSGAFFVSATYAMVAEGRINLGPIPIFGPLVGVPTILLGIWAFFRPWPTRIEIDTKEVRIFHRPTKVAILAHKNIICAKTSANPIGGSSMGILYRDTKGKTRAVKLYGGWRDNDGRYLKSITHAINIALNLTEEKTKWF